MEDLFRAGASRELRGYRWEEHVAPVRVCEEGENTCIAKKVKHIPTQGADIADVEVGAGHLDARLEHGTEARGERKGKAADGKAGK